MGGNDPIKLMFGGMEKLGPGSNAHTLGILHLLPRPANGVIVDAGCGTGRQTIVLAQDLGLPVHAVDSYEPFLNELSARAGAAGVGHLVEIHCMDIRDIPNVFPRIDLLWSEGAAYNIGFANALRIWASAIKAGGFAAVSEMCWLKSPAPKEAVEFFQSAYPDMRSVQENVQAAEQAGYRLLATQLLPRETWVDGYYDTLARRAEVLVQHPDPAVRAFAEETLQEIRVFEFSEDSYGYIFFVLQRS
jgi:cyclopropane fatty-acyl-phospholipid synthase-like methyltransferase